MKIKLSNGKSVLIDSQNFNLVNQYHWWEDKGYARTEKQKNKKVKVIYMHNLIMGSRPGHVDHINLNRLDNRKSNLRFCSKADNNRNVEKRSNNTTGFKGVFYKKDCNRYEAGIRVNRKRQYLGLYKTKKEAAMAYNLAAWEYFGEFARLNVVELEELL